ncbi:TetR/AcrR family transcriptional regulator C-terminal domain-containing protein [Streptomyces sp. NPDC047987]|uniref:TetR/AcrR family transcriptional regulator n=1 Tax=unclassified Streptomyces TaxID=2593676 RepID=UPI00342DF7D1
MVSTADRVKDPARTSVWLEQRPPSRTRRTDQPTGLDRERIVAASVRLLDAEGLDKFSMRRLAAELGVTAMSLYWYVDNKDDLLELALDSVHSEISPPREDTHWHDRLRGLAEQYRELIVRHVWVSHLAGHFLNIGPQARAMSNAVLDVIRATGLPLERQAGALSAVFQFVYGFGTVEGHFAQRSANAGLTQEEYYQQSMSAVRGQPGFDEMLESSEKMADARGGDTVEEMRDRDFTYALDLLIAGIEAIRAQARERGREQAREQ